VRVTQYDLGLTPAGQLEDGSETGGIEERDFREIQDQGAASGSLVNDVEDGAGESDRLSHVELTGYPKHSIPVGSNLYGALRSRHRRLHLAKGAAR
jgi:hypothetical protein